MIRPRHSLIAAVVLATTLSACDTATTDTVVLGDIRVAFEFEFDGSNLVTGQLRSASSTGSENISSDLSSRGGFTLAEIVAGRVSAGSIELIFPTGGSGVDLRAFEQAIVQLRAGSTTLEVASRSGFGTQDPDALNPLQNRDISSILAGGSFDAILQVVPAEDGRDDDTYLVEVVLTLTVEVEGV